MLQVKFHSRNMIVVWSNPEPNVLLGQGTVSGNNAWAKPPDLLIQPPPGHGRVSQPLYEFLAHTKDFCSGLAPPCWAAAWSHCRHSQGEHEGWGQQELLQGLAVHTLLGFPPHSLPPAHGTIQHDLPGPDSSFPDYLVVVAVGNEKRKMFISPKQRGTRNIMDCKCLWPQTE